MSDNFFDESSDVLMKQLAGGVSSTAKVLDDALGRSHWTAPPMEIGSNLDPATPAGLHQSTVAGDARNSIMDIPVTMKVVLGSATMPVAALQRLARGSIVKLDKKVGEAVDILINGRLIARGEVVVVDEASSRFGVTLTEIGNNLTSKK